ncbi:unnamed protein product, partial [Durusdinium trenchii]
MPSILISRLDSQLPRPVRAALQGRVLVLEGIEKAERNVLPLLNNLLENREMQLEDGRFLMSHGRVTGSGKVKGNQDLKLEPVHPEFIVIAIGMPKRGNPLDPPLRSRFAGHVLWPPSVPEVLRQINRLEAPPQDDDLKEFKKVLQVLQSFIKHAKQGGIRVPPLPDRAAIRTARLLQLFGGSSLAFIKRAYPLELMLNSTALGQLATGLASQGLREKEGAYTISSISSTASGTASATFRKPSGEEKEILVQAGTWLSAPDMEHLSPAQQKVVAAMLQDHAADIDMCLVGEKGVGKTMILRTFRQMLGYRCKTVFCFKDLMARDLLQRRSTDPKGQTEWQDSPVAEAAIAGHLVVLDGLQRLAPGNIYASLGPLLLDREATLPDGSRLVSPRRWRRLLEVRGLPEDCKEYEEEGIRFRSVHPAFRCIATAEWPVARGVVTWLDDEVTTLFHFHHVNPLPEEEQLSLATGSGTKLRMQMKESHVKVFRALLVYGDKLRKALVDEPGLEPLRLSLRVLLRIAKHLRQRPEDVHGALSRAFAACLRFLPNSSQEAVLGMLQMALRSTGAPTLPWTSSVPDTAESRRRREDLRELEYMAIQARMMGGGDMVDEAREKAETDRKKQREDRLRELRKLGQQGFSRKALDAASISGGVLRIGDVSCPLRTPSRPELVPDVAFVDIPQQTEILKDMLLDWSLGHHLLLVGNQGVGKNKLTDRLLGLLQCEREYVQLHRDTTVQSLTLSPCLKAGVVTWEDSPLLRAVKHGRCLVVDEADKAPLEVVCVLKALSEDGELSLSDGRTIVRPDSAIDRRDVVRMSSDFRLIVLANRPGYPFMGHDFFKLCGDVFSCHVVDNPDIASEVALLRSVGPDVPEEQVLQLSVLFAELREMVEAGQLAYPYSTRELVKLVSHAQRFPKDRLEELASTVFAFDLADEKKRTPLLGVLQRHGIATTEESIRLLDGYTSGDMSLKLDEGRDKSKDVVNKENPDGTRPPDMAPGGPKHGKWDGQEHIGGNQFAGGSGGTGTAGLGGRWGPYRLDVGQKLVQVSEDSKKGLDEETKRKAQEMADDAYRKRLAEMKMSLKEGQAYAALRDAVASQIQEMKVCLESQEARERERQWLKNQSTGELDENRLVDSITGCKTVYMRRGQPDSFAFGRQQHPKRITFVMDISGSMYTFNRIDRRLQRLQEVATFIFESFAGFEEKYQYRMVGHSGTGPEERLVEWAKPPLTDKDRLEIAKTMEAHAQFCYPGDHTLEATMRAIKEIGTQEADERLVLVVSDADLQ